MSDQTLREYAELSHSYISPGRISSLDHDWLSAAQISAIERLDGQEFAHRWQLARALAAQSPHWSRKKDSVVNKFYNKELDRKLDYVHRTFAGFSERR